MTFVMIKSKVVFLIRKTKDYFPRTGGGEPREGDFYWISETLVDYISRSCRGT